MTLAFPRRSLLSAAAALPTLRAARGASTAPIRVGVLLTAGAPAASAARAGLLAALLDVTDAGGMLDGRPLALVEADDRDDPFAAIAAARRLVESEGVAAVIGPLRSGLVAAVANAVTIPAGVPLLSPGAAAPALAALNDGDTVFRTALPDGLAARVLARLAREAGIGRAAILAAATPMERGFATDFTAAFQARGGQVTGSLAFEADRPSYRAEIQAVAARSAPEALLVAGDARLGAALLLREAIATRLFGRLLASGGMRDEAALARAGAMPEGLVGVAPAPSAAPARAAAFAGLLRRADPAAPAGSALAAAAHDALMLVALAIEAGRSAAPAAIAARLRPVSDAPGVEVGPGGFAAARAAIARGDEVNYEGASGPIAFDAAGDARGAVEHWTWRAGRVATEAILAG